jgi:membrane-associated protein
VLALFDVEGWLESGGLLLLALIVFAESGLFFGFFLPGDSLLFVAGFLSSEAGEHLLPPLPITAGVIFVAAVAGDQVGYIFGRKVGPPLFERPDSRLFKKSHLEKARQFFERRGPTAIVLARFVPIVRTFTPIIAGVAGMKYSLFVRYNVIGGLIWGVGVTTLGYFLGEIQFVRDNLEIAVVVVVLISLLPVAFEFWRHRRDARRSEVRAAVKD